MLAVSTERLAVSPVAADAADVREVAEFHPPRPIAESGCRNGGAGFNQRDLVAVIRPIPSGTDDGRACECMTLYAPGLHSELSNGLPHRLFEIIPATADEMYLACHSPSVAGDSGVVGPLQPQAKLETVAIYHGVSARHEVPQESRRKFL